MYERGLNSKCFFKILCLAQSLDYFLEGTSVFDTLILQVLPEHSAWCARSRACFAADFNFKESESFSIAVSRKERVILLPFRYTQFARS
jgi:hypothetical protein